MSAPKHIYRYRSLSDEKLLNRELETLENSYLYAPPFGSMNDPMEAFYETGGPVDFVVDAMLRAEGASRHIYSLLEEQVSKFALISFATAPDDLPMWAYYAGNFAGVCMEFDSSAISTGDLRDEELCPVTYARNALPPITVGDLAGDRMRRAVVARISRKRIEWKHEKEWRFVLGQVGPRHYVDDALTRVYLGPRIDPAHAAAVIDVLKNRPAEILQGEISGFELRFRTVKPPTPLELCDQVGQKIMDPATVSYDKSELTDFLRVPYEHLVDKCNQIATRPNFEELLAVGLSREGQPHVFLSLTHKLRSGRVHYDTLRLDRNLRAIPS
jgi:hypothetical protein